MLLHAPSSSGYKLNLWEEYRRLFCTKNDISVDLKNLHEWKLVELPHFE
jgi:hypothetical protein